MESQLEDWNKIYIPFPPNLSLVYCWDEDSEVLDYCLPILEESFSSLGAYISRENITLIKEFKIFVGVLSEHKTIRKEKYHNLALKIKKCVKKMNEVKIFPYLTKLGQMIPFGIKYGTVRLPTRQMFEYLLTKIFGVFQLLLTIENLCKQIGKILIGKIRTGHDYWVALAYLAPTARIRMLTLGFAQQLALFYEEIMPVLQYLKGSPRFALSQNSSLMQELKNRCRYEKDVDRTRSSTSKEIESGILDMFKDSDEKYLDVSGISFNFKTENCDLDHSLNNESKDSVDKANDKATLLVSETVSVPEISVSKNSMNGSKLQEKQKMRNIEKEKEILSLLDILKDNKESPLNSCESYMNQKSINMCSMSGVVDALMKSDDLGEVVEPVTTGNKIKKMKQKKKKVITGKLSKKTTVGIKGKIVSKKKKLLDQSDTKGSATDTVDDSERNVMISGEKGKIGKKKKKSLDQFEAIAMNEESANDTVNGMGRIVLKEGIKDKIVKKKKELSCQPESIAMMEEPVENTVIDIGPDRKVLKDEKIVKKMKKLVDQSETIAINEEPIENTINVVGRKVLKDEKIVKKIKKLLDQSETIAINEEPIENTINDIARKVMKDDKVVKKIKKLLDQSKTISTNEYSVDNTNNVGGRKVLKDDKIVKKIKKLLDQSETIAINEEPVENTINDIGRKVLKDGKIKNKNKKLSGQSETIAISEECANNVDNHISRKILKEEKKRKIVEKKKNLVHQSEITASNEDSIKNAVNNIDREVEFNSSGNVEATVVRWTNCDDTCNLKKQKRMKMGNKKHSSVEDGDKVVNETGEFEAAVKSDLSQKANKSTKRTNELDGGIIKKCKKRKDDQSDVGIDAFDATTDKSKGESEKEEKKFK